MLVFPFFLNLYSPSFRSSLLNTVSRGTSLNGSSVGDSSGDVWNCSSGSSIFSTFFLPFQRFFILYQMRSSVKDPLLLSVTLAVSLAVSAYLSSLNFLKAR